RGVGKSDCHRRLKPYCAPLPRNGCCDKSPYPLSGRREKATRDLLAQYVCGSACGESVSGLFRERGEDSSNHALHLIPKLTDPFGEVAAFIARYLGGPMSAERQPMRIFIFKSETSPDLRAFSDDPGGNKLPAQVATREERKKEETEGENKLVEVQQGSVPAKSGAKDPAERTDDPVRMYLREMASVDLLSREGEIAIAKRIEAGRE